MKNRFWLAAALFSALCLGPVHAISGPEVHTGLVLVEIGLESFESIPLFSPDARVAFAYKRTELALLERALRRVMHSSTLTHDQVVMIRTSLDRIRVTTDDISDDPITPEVLADWQRYVRFDLKLIRQILLEK